MFAPITQAGWYPARDFGPRLVAVMAGLRLDRHSRPRGRILGLPRRPHDRRPARWAAVQRCLHPHLARRVPAGSERADSRDGGPDKARKDGAPVSGPSPAEKQRVLFLCTHNSARSQMAEGLLRQLGVNASERSAQGAKLPTCGRWPSVRWESWGSISPQESKTLDRYLQEPFDYVITVCDQANDSCPIFPGGKRRLHWSLPDPSQAQGSDNEQLAVYRQVRDDLRQRIEQVLLEA